LFKSLLIFFKLKLRHKNQLAYLQEIDVCPATGVNLLGFVIQRNHFKVFFQCFTEATVIIERTVIVVRQQNSAVAGIMDDSVAVAKGLLVVPWQIQHIALESILQDSIHLNGRFVPIFGKDLFRHHDDVAAFHDIAAVKHQVNGDGVL
jgi:hypothetical protein